MFIAHVVGKAPTTPQERNVFREAKHIAPLERQSWWPPWFYKDLVPLGPRRDIEEIAFERCKQ